ncbi:MAG: hypothetical protein PHO37_03760 [Kiritimatiellae bacterium]|nr:hypothetical protein [Kiritimatiellia bacterium]
MQLLKDDYAAGLFDAQKPPCLSLYQPTHRGHPENQQDPIRFRNLVKKLEESLRREFSTKDIIPLLAPFWKLAEDFDFWKHTNDGLAVLGSGDLFRVYKLQRPVTEFAIAADSFHLKPLLRIMQSADRYYVLGLSQQEAKLFVGNRDALDPVELLPEAAQAIAAALEKGQDKPRAESWTFGTGKTGSRARHGHIEECQAEHRTERFFHAVDRAILKYYSQPSGLPLLLATLPEHQASFRRISRNPMLLATGIESHPDALSLSALCKQVWQHLEPYYIARLDGIIEMFGAAQSRELGTADLAQAMRAAVSGRVSTLLVEADRHIPGRVDVVTGGIEFDDLANPVADDLLDDLGAFVLKTGGQVVVVPTKRMPTKTGLAAIYRF